MYTVHYAVSEFVFPVMQSQKTWKLKFLHKAEVSLISWAYSHENATDYSLINH